MYGQHMLTIASRLDVMNRLGRAMADPTRSRILLSLLAAPGYPAQLASTLGLTRTNVSNHLACLRDCGLVVGVPVGRNVRYELSDPKLAHALEDLLGTILTVEAVCQCGTPECAAEATAGAASIQEVPA